MGPQDDQANTAFSQARRRFGQGVESIYNNHLWDFDEIHEDIEEEDKYNYMPTIWYEEWKQQVLPCVDNQLFGVLAHMYAGPIGDAEYRVYEFCDSAGERLCFPFLSCTDMLEDIRQRPGYQAVAKVCDEQWILCKLTLFYSYTQGYRFFHSFSGFVRIPMVGFQLMLTVKREKPFE